MNTVRRWCQGATVSSHGGVTTGAHLKPETRSQACAAVAEWEAKRKSSKAKTAAKKLKEAYADPSWRLSEAEFRRVCDDFAFARQLAESVYRPIPPSLNWCAKILEEVGMADTLEENGSAATGTAAVAAAMVALDAATSGTKAPRSSELAEAVKGRGGKPVVKGRGGKPTHHPGSQEELIAHPHAPKGRKGGGQFAKKAPQQTNKEAYGRGPDITRFQGDQRRTRQHVLKHGLKWGGQTFRDVEALKTWLGQHGVSYSHFTSKHKGAAEGLAAHEKFSGKGEGKGKGSKPTLVSKTKPRGVMWGREGVPHQGGSGRVAAEAREDVSVVGREASWGGQVSAGSRGGFGGSAAQAAPVSERDS